MINNPDIKQPPIVWWMIWGALLSGIFIIYFVVGSAGGAPRTNAGSPDSPVWMVGFAPFVISTIIRWLILPRIRNFQAAFSLFIVGLAMGEAPCILGVFAFPAHKAGLFALSVLGIVQFVPYFASRFDSREG